MNSMRGENQPTQLVIHNDDDTPDQFVMDLLRQVSANQTVKRPR